MRVFKLPEEHLTPAQEPSLTLSPSTPGFLPSHNSEFKGTVHPQSQKGKCVNSQIPRG